MIDQTILKYLEDKPQQLDFKGLIEFMVESRIPFRKGLLLSSIAITTLDIIFLDLNKIDNLTNTRIFFIILHEIAHYKRMVKLGREEVIRRLSLDDFHQYSDFLINEEMIADRYARLLFYHFNKVSLPIVYTQQLDIASIKMQYKFNLLRDFGFIQNKEERYYHLLNKYILV